MPKARIVVVEDEPAIRRGVVDALRLTGYDVSEAAERTPYSVRTRNTKLAPKAWAERIRLPRFMGLLMPSAPIAKKPRMARSMRASSAWPGSASSFSGAPASSMAWAASLAGGTHASRRLP